MLRVTNLRKEFDTVVAVDGVSLQVQRGELFGLLGPNGAGKTTTIRTVLNIIQPDSGEITFDGHRFTPEMWNIIGYLPEERGLYRKSKIISTILYFATLKGMTVADAKPQARQWLERFELGGMAHRKVDELSKGNQQKVQLICSLIHRPQLLILDEPFTGLDPVNQILLKDILMGLRSQNIAIVFSTHQMEQVEKLCDNICLINKGREVLGGALADIKKKYGSNSIHLEYDGDGSFLKGIGFIKRADVYQNYAELELNDIGKSSELLGMLNGKVALRKFEIVEPSLNSIFINVVGMPVEPRQPLPAPLPPVVPLPEASLSKDPRVRKAMVSMALSSLMCLVLIVFLGVQKEPSFSTIGLLVLGVLASVFQYLRMRKNVERDLLKKSLERGGV
ncbi:MAG TPA: ATP-binding cassette domain-containing protein [Bacteroidota bacterium]